MENPYKYFAVAVLMFIAFRLSIEWYYGAGVFKKHEPVSYYSDTFWQQHIVGDSMQLMECVIQRYDTRHWSDEEKAKYLKTSDNTQTTWHKPTDTIK